MLSARSMGHGWAPGAAILGLMLFAAPAGAEKVGVAAAVNPDAFSMLSGGDRTELKIGKSIFYNERINTSGSGLVQVLLVDGSTFTVGPGSDLVIDRFVYDPKKKQGEVVATFSKGVLRFVGGKLSKNEGGVTINTPAGALAIRGGILQTQLDGRRGIFSFLYGEEMILANRYRVFQPGWTIDTRFGDPTIRLTTADDIRTVMVGLTNGNVRGLSGNSQGDGDGGGSFKQAGTDSSEIDELIKDANTVIVQAEILTQLNNPPEPKETTNTPGQPDPDTPPPPEPPQEVTVRVLSAPGVYTAFPNSDDVFTTQDAGESGILGGGNYPDGTGDPRADDFQWTFTVVDGRVVGTVTGLIEAECSDGDCSELSTSVLDPVEVDFPFFEPNETSDTCEAGLCTVTDATTIQNDEVTNYVGTAVAKPGFFAYQVAPGEATPDGPVLTQPDDPLLIFGGEAHAFGEPSGRVYAFDLTGDIREQGAFAPFASSASSPAVNPDGPAPAVSPLLYKEQDSATEGRAVWLQTSLYINTTPSDDETSSQQQSFVNIALGGVNEETGGLFGARRGGVQEYVDTCNDGCIERESFSFSGDIATLGGPDGSHFLGTDNPNIVIGFDSTGTHVIGRDTPLEPGSTSVEEQSGSTYHIGIGQEVQAQDQTLDGELRGYAAGLVQSELPASDFHNVVLSESADDFIITFDPETNSLSASATLRDLQHGDGATSAYQINFGDDGGSDVRSAYIDNLHYAAIETPDETSVFYGHSSTYDNATSESYLASAAQLEVTTSFPETFADTSGALCAGCDFFQWGGLGARIEFGNQDPSQFVDNIHLGWWVAGDVTAAADLEVLWDQNASANYEGHVIGNVANKLGADNWRTYEATGDLDMYWSFGTRTGDLTISNFDSKNIDNGLTFSGSMCAPGVTGCTTAAGNHFGGAISTPQGSTLALSGSAAGSFVNNGAIKAAGVIGNWNVSGNAYKATGIFGGNMVPGN